MPMIIIEFEVENLDSAMQVMENNTYTLERLARDAQGHGATHHMFYTNGQTVFAIDEWDSEVAFHEFFDSNPEVQALMAQSHVRKKPTTTVLMPIKVAGTF